MCRYRDRDFYRVAQRREASTRIWAKRKTAFPHAMWAPSAYVKSVSLQTLADDKGEWDLARKV